MNNRFKVFLPIIFLVLASLACGKSSNTSTGKTLPAETQPSTSVPLVTATQPSTSVPLATATQPGGGKMLLKDDFIKSTWGTGTDVDSSIEYANAALQFIIYTKNWFAWSTPNSTNYQNVRLEVTAINNQSDSTTALGFLCNKQPDESSFYYFAMTPAGEYAIAKAVAGQNDLFLTNNDKWASSKLITKNAPSYRLAADCGNGGLTFYVDDQKIASVSDTTYTSGFVGLLVWSGEEATNTNIAFDDFLVTELP